MTDLTPEQIEQWANDKGAETDFSRLLSDGKNALYQSEFPMPDERAALHAHALHLQLQAENAEKQATIERLKEAARAVVAENEDIGETYRLHSVVGLSKALQGEGA